MSFNGTGVTNPVQVLQGINDMTNNLFGVFILVVVWGIIYYSLSSAPSRESIVASSFATMIIAILLRYLHVVQDFHLGITVVLFIGSLVMLINRS